MGTGAADGNFDRKSATAGPLPGQHAERLVKLGLDKPLPPASRQNSVIGAWRPDEVCNGDTRSSTATIPGKTGAHIKEQSPAAQAASNLASEDVRMMLGSPDSDGAESAMHAQSARVWSTRGESGDGPGSGHSGKPGPRDSQQATRGDGRGCEGQQGHRPVWRDNPLADSTVQGIAGGAQAPHPHENRRS